MPGMIRLHMRTVILVLLLFTICAALPAQQAYLENSTDMTIYVRSGGVGGYRQVPAGGILPVPSDRYVEGFAYSSGSFSLPTLRLEATELRNDEFRVVSGEDLSEIVVRRADEVADSISGPRVDNQYLDWLGIDPVFARGRARAPLGSFVDSGSGRESVPLSDTLLWERAGTDVEWLKTLRVDSDLFFAASTYSQFARATSLSIYLYGDADFPEATIEVEAGSRNALILLWRPRVPEPVVVGNSVSSEFFVEGQIWLDAITRALAPEVTGNGSLTTEIASGARTAGIWEEYVLARVPLADLWSE